MALVSHAIPPSVPRAFLPPRPAYRAPRSDSSPRRLDRASRDVLQERTPVSTTALCSVFRVRQDVRLALPTRFA